MSVIDVIGYDPATGVFRWKEDRRNGSKAGDVAGYVDEKGYRRIQIAGRTYKAHRLALLIATGKEPSQQVDHVNGNKGDNRLCNLREVNNAENQQNIITARRNNKVGLRGVVRYGKRFASHIWTPDGGKYLGSFDTPELAHQCYLAAKSQLHKGYIS